MCEFGTHTLIVSMSIKEIDRHVRCAHALLRKRAEGKHGYDLEYQLRMEAP